MSTLELRNDLVQKILLIDDKSFLEALKTIIDTKVNNPIYQLSEFQKERIKEGQEQYQNGKTISDNAVNEKIDQWLNAK